MKQTIKQKIAKSTSTNYNLNKKVLQIKKSWDEVSGILEKTGKKKK